MHVPSQGCGQDSSSPVPPALVERWLDPLRALCAQPLAQILRRIGDGYRLPTDFRIPRAFVMLKTSNERFQAFGVLYNFVDLVAPYVELPREAQGYCHIDAMAIRLAVAFWRITPVVSARHAEFVNEVVSQQHGLAYLAAWIVRKQDPFLLFDRLALDLNEGLQLLEPKPDRPWEHSDCWS